MRSNCRLLVALFLVAFAMRLGYGMAKGLGREPGAQSSDASDYCRYAWNLAQGNGFRGPEPGQEGDVISAYLPPGLPTLYAALFKLFGRNYAVLRIVQCVIGAATVVLLYRLARTIMGERIAWLASAIFTFYPSAVFYSYELLTETLFTFFLMWFSVLCVSYFALKPTGKSALVMGLVLGLTILIRPATTAFIPFFVLWGLIVLHGLRRKLLIAEVLVVALAVVLPWSIRNYGLYHRFVLVSPTAWTVFIQGNNDVVVSDPDYAGYCVWYTKVPGWEHKFDGIPQIDREPIAKELGTIWMSENKDKWGYLIYHKFIRFWSPFLHQNNRANRYVMLFSWGPVLLFFLPAFFVTLVTYTKDRAAPLLMHLFILCTMLNALIYFALPRYRYPMELYCIILASTTAVWLWDRIRPGSPTAVETNTRTANC